MITEETKPAYQTDNQNVTLASFDADFSDIESTLRSLKDDL
jgi:hypothetical protein